MHQMEKPADNWTAELVRFLRERPEINAVRIDPAAHRLAVATIGEVDLAVLETQLAATIAAVETRVAAESAQKIPGGYSLRKEGGSVIVGRDTCVTAEKMWLWREMEWPEIKAEPSHEDQEWRTLLILASICGVFGVAGTFAKHFAPDMPWLAKGLFLIGLIAGGWDAAVDTWENLKKREIDIHFRCSRSRSGRRSSMRGVKRSCCCFYFPPRERWRNTRWIAPNAKSARC
jgi:Cd2+/Zn2+-exporting ATPase